MKEPYVSLYRKNRDGEKPVNIGEGRIASKITHGTIFVLCIHFHSLDHILDDINCISTNSSYEYSITDYIKLFWMMLSHY